MADPYVSTRHGARASFEHAYAVTVQLRESTGADQLVITGNTVQPFRVWRQEPRHPEEILALVA